MNFQKIYNLILVTIAFENCIISQEMDQNTCVIGGVQVDYIVPKTEIKGTILVLPGWNFSKNDICEKSNFCNKAIQAGYMLILPEMLKSIYASQLYPETRNEWRKYPTLKWVTDTLIPWFQLNKKKLRKGENNFIFGISTGGRGVAMVSIYTDGIFIAGAALSGDYNPPDFPQDNLMRGYYGELLQFPERWNGYDNPKTNVRKLKIPLFLAHAKADKIVPFEQTVNFYNEIQKLHPELGCKMYISELNGHDYNFWSSEYDNVFDFFKSHSKN